jgi:hypothetical protein
VACTQPCTAGQGSTSSPAANHECISRCTSVQPSSLRCTKPHRCTYRGTHGSTPFARRSHTLSHGHTRSSNFSNNVGRVVVVSAGLCPFGTPSRLSEPAPPMTAPCPPHRPRASTARGLRSASECSQSRRTLRTPQRRWASTS